MKIIITALRPEAVPLIEALGLKHDSACRKLSLYASGEILLIVGGVGKVSAAVATTYAIHLAGLSQDHQIINVGMCGAALSGIQLGDAFIINKLRDHGTQRDYYPEMLVSQGLSEASLETFDRPVLSSGSPNLACDLVDMEATGVFQSAQTFLSAHQLFFFKVATDYLNAELSHFPAMLKHYQNGLAEVLPCLANLAPLGGSSSILSVPDLSLLDAVTDFLNLTKTQSHQLRDAAQGYLIRGGKDLGILRARLDGKPVSKQDRNRILTAILESLRV